MIPFLKLIRLPNLIIIAATQLLVRYCLIMPAFILEFNRTHNFPGYLSKVGFSMLMLSTLLIAAAGYIINDVYDTDIDAVNKPGKNLVGTKFSVKFAKRLFNIFSVVGILLGVYLALAIGKPVMAFIQVFAVASLYRYAAYFKKRLLIGNLIIALLSALSLIIVGLYEPSIYPNIQFILYYGVFAFMVSLTREIIKDVEDVDGDELAQCKTIPIRFGIKASKMIIVLLIAITMAALTWFLYRFFFINKVVNFATLVGMFLIPFAALAWLVISAREKKDYYYASMFTKGIMIYGLLSIIPFWYFFLR